MKTTMTKRKPRIIYTVSYGENSNTENGFECEWNEEKEFTNARDTKRFLKRLEHENIEWYLYIHIYMNDKENEYDYEYELDCSESYPILDIFAAYETRS